MPAHADTSHFAIAILTVLLLTALVSVPVYSAMPQEELGRYRVKAPQLIGDDVGILAIHRRGISISSDATGKNVELGIMDMAEFIIGAKGAATVRLHPSAARRLGVRAIVLHPVGQTWNPEHVRHIRNSISNNSK